MSDKELQMVKGLMEYLRNNHNPYVKLVIDMDSVELTQVIQGNHYDTID